MSQPQLQQQNDQNTSNSKKKRYSAKGLNKSDNQNQQNQNGDTPLAVKGAGDGGTPVKKQQQPQQHTNCQSKKSKQPLQSKADELDQTSNIVGEADLLSLCMEHLQRQMHSILLCNEVNNDSQIHIGSKSNSGSKCSTRRNSLDEGRQRRKSGTSTPPLTEQQLNVENNRPLSKSARLRQRRKAAQRNKYVAIDCEMVGVGYNGQDDMLARVSIVNKQGEVLLDKFVKPWHKVIDYRTSISGIRPKDIENGEDFHVVQDQVLEILQGKILVGHAIRNDLAVLHLKHPYKNIRDTARYKPLCRLVSNGRTPSLKLLSQAILGMEIQIGEHNSVEDARAAMKIYNRLSSEWEKYIQNHQRHHK